MKIPSITSSRLPVQEGDGQPHLLKRIRTDPYGPAGAWGRPKKGLPRYAYRENIPPPVPACRWIDVDLQRCHKMERASQSLDHRFLDGPEQGRCLGHISPRQPQDVVQLLVMKNSVQGIFSPKFIGRCRINADIGCIPAKGGPDLPASLAEGDGRATSCFHQKFGPAERAVGHMNGGGSAVAPMSTLPGGIFHRRHVTHQDGSQTILVCCPLCPASFAGITRQGCIKCRSPAMAETHGMDGYVLAICGHIHSPHFRAAVRAIDFLKFRQDVS